jgi:hypothetical protein
MRHLVTHPLLSRKVGRRAWAWEAGLEWVEDMDISSRGRRVLCSRELLAAVGVEVPTQQISTGKTRMFWFGWLVWHTIHGIRDAFVICVVGRSVLGAQRIGSTTAYSQSVSQSVSIPYRTEPISKWH